MQLEQNTSHYCVIGTTRTTACCMNGSSLAFVPKEDPKGTYSSLKIFFNDHSYSYFCRREPKRLLVPRVEKGKSSQSFDDEFVILIYYFFLPSSSFSKVL